VNTHPVLANDQCVGAGLPAKRPGLSNRCVD